jgi:hypothetical protein
MLKSRLQLDSLNDSDLVAELIAGLASNQNSYTLRVAQALHQRMFGDPIGKVNGQDPVLQVADLVLRNWAKFEGLQESELKALQLLRQSYGKMHSAEPAKKVIIDSQNVRNIEDKVGLVDEDPDSE